MSELIINSELATAERWHFEMQRFPQQQNDPTPSLGATLAKNANQHELVWTLGQPEMTSLGLLVLKTSLNSGLPIAWITGHATIPQP